MRHAVLLAITCAALAASAAEPGPPGGEQVEALSDADLDALDAPGDGGAAAAVVRAPDVQTEHDFDRRLLALPLVLVALLAWNTQWKSTGRTP